MASRALRGASQDNAGSSSVVSGVDGGIGGASGIRLTTGVCENHLVPTNADKTVSKKAAEIWKIPINQKVDLYICGKEEQDIVRGLLIFWARKNTEVGGISRRCPPLLIS